MTATTQQNQIVQRYPVRGALWGLCLGIGLALWSILLSVIVFGDWTMTALLVIVGVIIGVLWSVFAPPKPAVSGSQAPQTQSQIVTGPEDPEHELVDRAPTDHRDERAPRHPIVEPESSEQEPVPADADAASQAADAEPSPSPTPPVVDGPDDQTNGGAFSQYS